MDTESFEGFNKEVIELLKKYKPLYPMFRVGQIARAIGGDRPGKIHDRSLVYVRADKEKIDEELSFITDMYDTLNIKQSKDKVFHSLRFFLTQGVDKNILKECIVSNKRILDRGTTEQLMDDFRAIYKTRTDKDIDFWKLYERLTHNPGKHLQKNKVDASRNLFESVPAKETEKPTHGSNTPICINDHFIELTGYDHKPVFVKKDAITRLRLMDDTKPYTRIYTTGGDFSVWETPEVIFESLGYAKDANNG